MPSPLPLINSLPKDIQQVWYADDASASGRLQDLGTWWDKLTSLGPAYGYHTNATKTLLVTTPPHYQSAFRDTQVNISMEGKPHLGTSLGSKEYSDKCTKEKVAEWSLELEKLTTITETEPHAAYAAITHGLASKWTYLSRTTPDISEHLEALERIIRMKLIPAMTGRPPLVIQKENY